MSGVFWSAAEKPFGELRMTVSGRYGSDFRFVIFLNINPKFVLLWKTLQGLKPIKGFVNSSIRHDG